MNKLRKMINNPEIVPSPTTAYRMLKGFIRARIFRKNTLRAIELYPTFACQMKCDMCSVERYKQERFATPPLSLTDYSELALDGARLGATTIIILGGEPTLFKDIYSLISIFHQRKYYVHMVSNGMSLDQVYIRRLKEHGLDSLFLSLESMSEEINDNIREVGHFQKTMKNIAWCRDEKLQVGLAPVFFSGHIDQALDVIKFCHREGLRASGGQIAPTGQGIHMKLLSSEEISRIREAVECYPNFVFDWSFSYFGDICCPAGREKVGITMYGDVIPCSYNPIKFGNILDEPLRSILKKMGQFSQFKKRYRGCLCSENAEYIKDYLLPAANSSAYPLDYKKHPEICSEISSGAFCVSSDKKGRH